MQRSDTRRKAAVAFLKMVSSGRAAEAFAAHLAADFRHHNPYFPADPAALREAMDADARENPGKRLTVHHSIVEGDVVVVHSHVRQRDEDPGWAVVHIFRFDGDRIAELWDVGQAVPADSPNVNGVF